MNAKKWLPWHWRLLFYHMAYGFKPLCFVLIHDYNTGQSSYLNHSIPNLNPVLDYLQALATFWQHRSCLSWVVSIHLFNDLFLLNNGWITNIFWTVVGSRIICRYLVESVFCKIIILVFENFCFCVLCSFFNMCLSIPRLN